MRSAATCPQFDDCATRRPTLTHCHERLQRDFFQCICRGPGSADRALLCRIHRHDRLLKDPNSFFSNGFTKARFKSVTFIDDGLSGLRFPEMLKMTLKQQKDLKVKSLEEKGTLKFVASSRREEDAQSLVVRHRDAGGEMPFLESLPRLMRSQ